ncbi:acylphosphatase [Candidatus Omnitrophota bacterium]
MKRIHCFYSGRVQGVGFRFTAERIAIGLGLVGWVKNLPDGRVELVSEGEEDTLQRLLAEVDQYFSRYIKDANVSWMEATGEFKDFGLKF